MSDLHDHPEAPSLALDLKRMMARRRTLALLAGAGAGGVLAACGGGGGSASRAATTATSSSSSSSSSASSGSSTSSASTASGSCTVAATETNGPYPADGTNSVGGSVVNVLTQSGIVRSNITTSFGSYSGTAAGVPLTLTLTIEANCTPVSGYAVYIWHCTEAGLYSLYTDTGQNYLRGVQVTDGNGQVTFTTIVPGCYSGRMTHIHVEIYASLSTATVETNTVKVTQLTFPLATLQSVYNNVSGYSASIANLAAISYSSDNVFGDDTAAQLAAATVSVSGDYSAGFAATATIAV